jgi:hypothetical protein
MICPSCQRANDPRRRYCGKCGCNFDPVCRDCGFVNDHEDRFCGGCGTVLATEHGGVRPAVVVAPYLTAVPATPATRATPATPGPVDELAGLFSSQIAAPDAAELPSKGIAQDDLDRLFGVVP